MSPAPAAATAAAAAATSTVINLGKLQKLCKDE
jgi:hypothetical protein